MNIYYVHKYTIHSYCIYNIICFPSMTSFTLAQNSLHEHLQYIYIQSQCAIMNNTQLLIELQSRNCLLVEIMILVNGMGHLKAHLFSFMALQLNCCIFLFQLAAACKDEDILSFPVFTQQTSIMCTGHQMPILNIKQYFKSGMSTEQTMGQNV